MNAIAKRTKVSDVRKWLVALGILTAGNMSRAEAEMKLRAYVPLLQDRFPPEAFTQASLEAVASRCRFFPSYADVGDYLADWWKAHRPAPPALPPPPVVERPPPTPEELAHVRECVATIVANMRSTAILADTVGRSFDVPLPRPGPRHLTPEQLDRINPLPNGRKRTNDATLSAAPVDPDASSETADEDETAAD
jgi:hypothetical protein